MRSCGLAVTKTDRRILSLSFAPPKESDQRKGVRKRQPFLFFAYCALPFPLQKTGNGSRLFRVALAPIYNQNSAIVLNPGQNRGYWMTSPPGWLFYCHFRHLGWCQCYWKTRGYIGITDTGGVIFQ